MGSHKPIFILLGQMVRFAMAGEGQNGKSSITDYISRIRIPEEPKNIIIMG
jgi:hypothetical protein